MANQISNRMNSDVDADTHYSESPFLGYLGTELEEWRDGFARIRLTLRPHHLNRAGVVHGGLISALIDHAGSFCGLYCSVPGNRRYGMTLSLTCNYLAQSETGTLIVEGRRTKGGRQVYFSATTVQTEGGLVVATGTSVHRYRTGSDAIEGVPARG